MAIKSGQILNVGNGFVIDRIQTGGPGQINIPEEKIYELGNYQAVATVRDIPDLSFDMESFDMSTEIEALLTGQDPTATVAGDEFDFLNSMPLDIISPFKTGGSAFTIVRGLVVPYLTLESVTYRFGVRASSAQSFTLRGDAIYYIPGTPVYQDIALVDNTLTYSLGNTAIAYTESGDTIYALGVCVKNPTTYTSKRLFYGTHYTNTANDITLLDDWFDEGYTRLHVVYGTTTVGTYAQAVHPTDSVKPAAVRGKDIELYISDGAATPTLVNWSGVQSVEVTRSVNLDPDEELGNTHYVAQDYDVADVTGSINLRSADAAELWERVANIAGVATNVVVGPHSATPLAMEIRIKNPDSGAVMKTLYVPDARFVLPGISGRVQQKLEVPLSFSSDGGTLLVYEGSRP